MPLPAVLAPLEGSWERTRRRILSRRQTGGREPLPHGEAAGWQGWLVCAGQAHGCPFPRSGLLLRGLGSVPVGGFLRVGRLSGGSRRHRQGIGLLVSSPSKIVGLTKILPSH